MSYKHLWKALLIIALFTFAYLLLAITKHNHYLSGYDLAVYDQVIWKYAVFHNPLTTVHAYPFTNLLTDHVELTLPLLAPLFWIWNNALMLLIFQVIFFCLSGLPLYLLARKKGLSEILSLTLLFSYLFFFGTQNALWNDFHSNVLGVGFLSWMIYFLESGQSIWTWIMLVLCVLSKEDMAFLTLGVGLAWLGKGLRTVILSKTKNIFFTFVQNDKIKNSLSLILFSFFYLFLIFVVYFPHFTLGYRFSGTENIFQSALHFSYFADTTSKREIIAYALGWFGFLPLLAPIFLIPALLDLYHFFVIGHLVESAQEIFLHYRVSLAPLLLWPTIYAIMFIVEKVKSSFKGRVQLFLALYLLCCAFFIQYALHLPLSYLTKSWLWHENPSIATINKMLTYLPEGASVVSQNNITPHIDHRDTIFTLWSSSRGYKSLNDSPCGKLLCPWFHWVGNPHYMIVDTSPYWDIRHFLQNRPDFLDALNTFEKLHKVQVVYREGTTTLYKVLQNP